VDGDAKRALKCRTEESRQRIEMSGSGGLKRTKPKFGCWVIEEKKKKKKKKKIHPFSSQ
jgi:hypothetical protein